MTQRRRSANLGPVPIGVLLDVAKVETVFPTPPPATVHDAPPQSEQRPVVHRKPVVSPEGARESSPDLTGTDRTFDFPIFELERPAEEVQSLTWTPEHGFVEHVERADPDDHGDSEEPSKTRVIRRRPVVGPEHGAGAGESDDSREFDDGIDQPGAGEPAQRFVPVPGPRKVVPPRDLVAVVQDATGVDTSGTEIDRSPMVSDRAAQLGAIAFTERATVHLPEELGSIEDPHVRSIVAHELVHVAQQRARGGDAPAESSTEGRQLEWQARAVQRSVSGGGVLPTFLRNRPMGQMSQGPIGVQRLASEHPEWLGADLSEEDYSDVEPRGANDMFDWQEREGEPFPSEWQARREWAEKFEQDHSSALQLRRDERYTQLSQEVTGGTAPLSRDAAIGVRRRLESEMPYQFGPPFGVDPYPDELAGGESAAGAAAVVPVATAGETRAADQELVHITNRARTAHSTAGDGSYSMSNLDDIFERRFDRERAIRLEVLHAMQLAAIGEGAIASHVVSLSDEDLAQIRAAVDLEIPLNVPNQQYLDTSSIMRISVAGVVDAEPTAATATTTATTGGAERSAGTPAAAGGAAGAAATSPAGGAAADPTADAQTDAATDVLRQITDRVNAEVPAAGAGEFRMSELDDRFEARFELEKGMRLEVLQAKIKAAVENGATIGTVVAITETELDQIHQAVNLELPLNVPNLLYVDTDDNLSHTITQADIDAYRPAGATTPAAVASTTTPATPAAETADMTSTPTTDLAGGDEPATVGGVAATAISTAVASGTAALVHMLAGDEPYAGQEMAARVVEQLTDLDLELLTRRLWVRVRRELRAELLIDRERAGVLADVR
jgi:hypothetical protein